MSQYCMLHFNAKTSDFTPNIEVLKRRCHSLYLLLLNKKPYFYSASLALYFYGFLIFVGLLLGGLSSIETLPK